MYVAYTSLGIRRVAVKAGKADIHRYARNGGDTSGEWSKYARKQSGCQAVICGVKKVCYGTYVTVSAGRREMCDMGRACGMGDCENPGLRGRCTEEGRRGKETYI